MARPDTETAVTLSVLDRLIDDDLHVIMDPVLGRRRTVELLKKAIRRDLEWLLNTRRTPEEAPESSEELHRSLYHYGLPDLTSFSVSSSKSVARLAWLVESVIATFEPRLDAVRVSFNPDSDHAETKMLRFQIEAMLKMDPAPERISFDTTLELTSGAYSVKGDAGAR